MFVVQENPPHGGEEKENEASNEAANADGNQAGNQGDGEAANEANQAEQMLEEQQVIQFIYFFGFSIFRRFLLVF
jgi:hypothetical protein